jgi:hypothetical protein
MLKNNKAQIRVTEAFLSAFIIFSALAICTVLSPPVGSGGGQNTLAARGMQLLVRLDDDGWLGETIADSNWTALSDAFRLSLPVGVVYNLTVYDANMQQVNSVPISNGNLVGDVVSVDYLCASQGLQYRSYLLRLQLAVVR